MTTRRPSLAASVALAFPIACCASAAASAPEGAVTTGFDGVVAEIAELDGPAAVAIDAVGRIFISESRADRVSIFDAKGARLGGFGVSGTAPGAMHRPTGIALAPDGTIFVADTDNHRVTVYAPDGRHLRQWGARGADAGRFSFPEGLAADDRFVYVADTGNGRVQVFDHHGAFQHIMATGIHHDDALFRPIGIAVDGHGVTYVADADRDTIHCFDERQRSTHFGEWGSFPGLVAEPRGLAVHDGLLHVADSRNDRVQVFFRPEPLDRPQVAFQWGRPPQGERLADPIDVAIAPSGEFAVVIERASDRARIFAKAQPPVGQTRDSPRPSRFGDLVACDGDLVVVHDEQTETLAVFTMTGNGAVRITDVGGRGREPGRLIRPSAVVLDAARGELTVADAGNSRLQVFRVRRDPVAPPSYDPLAGIFVQSVRLPARLGAAANRLTWPPRADDIAHGSDGRWFLLDTRNAAILVLDDRLQHMDLWTDDTFIRPTRLALDADRRRLYVADPGRHCIDVLGLDGTRIASLTGPNGDEPPRFNPVGMAVSGDGTLWVTDAGRGRLVRFDEHGHAEIDERGELRRPAGIAIDREGHTIVLDPGLQVGLVFGADGAVRGRFRPWPKLPPPTTVAAGANPRVDGDGWREMLSNGGSYVVRWRPVPDPWPLNREFTIEVKVYDAARPDEPLTRVLVSVDAAMPHHRHGMTAHPIMRRLADGGLGAQGMRFHMPGRWELYIDITRDGVTERAQTAVFVE